MTVKIGWTPFKQLPDMESMDLVYFEPERLNYYKDSTSYFMKCPAVSNFHKKFFVIKSPFDLELNYNRKQGDVKISPKQSLNIGKITMQRKGGTPDPTSLQFKFNPLSVIL